MPVIISAFLTAIYLYPLEILDPDQEIDESIEPLKKQVNASEAPISITYYHATSGWIVIGDQQGNGKNFDQK